MTNKQLAGARRAMRQFPDLSVRKTGGVLTPYRLDAPETTAGPLTVTDAMGEQQITFDLIALCEAIA
jgi:hypothetical protein